MDASHILDISRNPAGWPIPLMRRNGHLARRIRIWKRTCACCAGNTSVPVLLCLVTAKRPIQKRSSGPKMEARMFRSPTLACGEVDCNVVCETMLSLCQHVNEDHKRDDIVIEDYRFNSFREFEIWRARMEVDTMSHFTKVCPFKDSYGQVSGRLRRSSSRHGAGGESYFRYYQCHQSGHTVRTAAKRNDPLRLPPQRNRSSKKLGRYCTAFMNIRIDDHDGYVFLHYYSQICNHERVPRPLWT